MCRWEDNIRMNHVEIYINTRNRVLFEGPCECGIEPPGSIGHGVSKLLYLYTRYISRIHGSFYRQSIKVTTGWRLVSLAKDN